MPYKRNTLRAAYPEKHFTFLEGTAPFKSTLFDGALTGFVEGRLQYSVPTMRELARDWVDDSSLVDELVDQVIAASNTLYWTLETPHVFLYDLEGLQVDEP